MKKIVFLVILFLLSIIPVFSQVGIGTTTPNASSLLDITATDKGVLIPRIALASTSSFAPLLAHVAGMVVYNTATVVSATPSLSVSPGQYNNDGTKWVKVSDDTTSKNYSFLRTSDNLPATTVGDQAVKAYRTGRTKFGDGTTDPNTSNVRLFGPNDWLATVNVGTNMTDYSKLINVGMYSGMSLKPSASSSSNYVVGSQVDMFTETATTQDFFNIAGNTNYLVHKGTGTIIDVIASNNLIGIEGAGNMTNVYGGKFGYYNFSTGIMTNAYGVFIDASFTSNPNTITNKWGVYQAGTNDKNYFAGNTKIGLTPATTNVDALLELESTNKGLLLPRVALSSSTSFLPLSAHTAGMKVYNTATVLDVTPGEYYNNGTSWVRVLDAIGSNNYAFLKSSTSNTLQSVGDHLVNAYRNGRTLFGNFGTTPDFTMSYPLSPTTNVVSIQQDDFTAAEYSNAASNDFFQAIGYGMRVTPTVDDKTFYGINGGIEIKASSTRPITIAGGESNGVINRGTGLIQQALNQFAVYNIGAGNINNTKNLYAYLGNFSTGDIGLAEGLSVQMENYGGSGSIITNLYGVNVSTLNSVGGLISNAYGFRANLTNAGTITNGYGLYLDDVIATNQFGIYQAGTNDKNNFSGRTHVGNQGTDPDNSFIYGGGHSNVLNIEEVIPAAKYVANTQILQVSTEFDPPAAYSGNLRLLNLHMHTKATASNLATSTMNGIIMDGVHKANTPLATMLGMNMAAYNSSASGTITNAIGVKSTTGNSGTGTITNNTGLYANIFNSTTGTIVNAYGIRADFSNAGTITNAYGLYLDDVLGTNQYGVYQVAANDKNYFNGSVGIKTNDPKAVLDIAILDDRGILVRSGNSSGDYTNSQLSFGWNNSETYRHAIKTRHNSTGEAGNGFDFFLWDDSVSSTANPPVNAVSIELFGEVGAIGINRVNPRAELDVTGTGAIIVPNGTTAQQPAAPIFGMIRYNSTIGRGEMYVNDLNGDGTQGDTGWRPI